MITASEYSAVNNAVVSLLTFGEGYHNYHHTFAGDYRNGVRWYQFDPSKWLIWSMSKVGLASGLRRINALFDELAPDTGLTMAEIAERTGIAWSSVRNELRRDADLFAERSDGRWYRGTKNADAGPSIRVSTGG